MTTFVNAAPQTNMLGTLDKSTRALVSEPESRPTHLAKVYGYAKKGPTTPQLVVGDSRSSIYGAESFDVRQPWATHATVVSNALNEEGNAQMFQRLKPADAGPNASIRIWADVLSTTITVYQRNTDGTIKRDVSGNPLAATPGSTVAGYKIKFVAEEVSLDEDDVSTFGLAVKKAGDQTDGAEQSERYPLFDIDASHFGAYGNNLALRVWAPTTASSQPLDERLLASRKVYPFRFQCLERPDALTTPRVVTTLSAAQYTDVCLKPDVIDPNNDSLLSIQDVFIQSYQDLNTKSLPPKWGPFGRLHVYQSALDELLGLLATAERLVSYQQSDLKGEPDEDYRYNLFGLQTANGVEYHTAQIVTAGGGIRFTENTVVYAKGGSDGTMNETLFADLVSAEVAEYSNVNSVLQDRARYPESVIYDSGFPLEAKYALMNFIAVRKDTWVVLGTHVAGSADLTLTQESALGAALRTRVQSYPESEYYGTQTMRGVLVGGSGKYIQSGYRKRLPLTIELAKKSARYMGAGSGKWRAGEGFDKDPANNIDYFTDINVTFRPTAVRNQDWANGLNYVESYDRRQNYWAALQTVYDNDTSVLNGMFTMIACVELQKIGDMARRKFSGRQDLTNAQLIEKVNEFITKECLGKFDDRFVIVPDTFFTKADEARGFSWTTVIKIYAPTMKTAASLTIEAYRIEDLVQ